MSAKKKQPEVDVLNEVNRVPMSADSRAKMSLNIYDLQYLIRLQDLSNDAFKDTFNEEFRKEVAKSVAQELAEVLSPIYQKLSELADGQKLIAEDIATIKRRLDIMEDEVKTDKKEIANIHKRLDRKKEKIEELERCVKNLQPDDIASFRKEMRDLAPLLRKSVRINSNWNIVFRIASGVAIGVLLMWFILKYWWIKLFIA
jgi:chromosome segregation ATPase